MNQEPWTQFSREQEEDFSSKIEETMPEGFQFNCFL